MEGKFRWVLVTAIAPVTWGTTYFVTHRYLPAGYPLYCAAIRALPAGLLLCWSAVDCRKDCGGGGRWCWAR